MLPVTELPVEAPVHELSMWMPASSEPLTIFMDAVLLLLHRSMPSKICVAATVCAAIVGVQWATVLLH